MMNLKQPTQRVRKGAFTRVDLLAMIAAVVAITTCIGFNRFGERGRIACCTRNLQVLGEAMQNFANDHGSALPPAGVEQLKSSWDTELEHYLQPAKTVPTNAMSPGAMKQMGIAPKSTVSISAPIFACPSDLVKRDHPRSYTMSTHDMQPYNWPPGPDNTTGVGLAFNKNNITNILGKEAVQKKLSIDDLALVKLSWLPDPANTLWLTELISPENALGHRITVGNTEEQIKPFNGDTSHFHNGRFNYLLADGHVESLTLFQAGLGGGAAGIWTIKAGD
jgi:prepilin-type processing-associated H-X9-DG protein